MMTSAINGSAILLVSGVCAAVAAGASPVCAQTRPSNALFVEIRPDPARGQRLDITVGTAGGYDKDTSLDGSQPSAIGLLGPAGQSIMLTANASYASIGHRMQFRATAASTTRYYGSLDQLLHSPTDDASHGAAAGFLFHTSQTTFVVNQTANYASSLVYSFLPGNAAVTPGVGPAATADYGLSNSEVVAYSSAAEYTRHVTTRDGLSAAAGWEHSDISGGRADRHQLNVYRARLGGSHLVGHNLTMLAGYTYRTGDIAAGGLIPYGQVLNEHGAEVGFDYRRPLSATRTLMVQARVGGATILLPAGVIADSAVGGERRYDEFTGQVTATYDFGRTWQTNASVRHGIEYVLGLGQPVVADSCTARIDGLLARRVDVRAAAAYASGASAVTRAASLFNTYTGTVRVRFALTRTWASYAEYFYYLYDSRGTAPLVPGLPPSLQRNGVRAGFMLRVPAVGK